MLNKKNLIISATALLALVLGACAGPDTEAGIEACQLSVADDHVGGPLEFHDDATATSNDAPGFVSYHFEGTATKSSGVVKEYDCDAIYENGEWRVMFNSERGY